jgi:GNAT superfamily N-acetyltransferase
MTEPMQVREASLADRGLIIAFDHLARLDPARLRLIVRLLSEATCLVAERANGVVAYAALEYTFYGNGFIPILYVAEPERRRGIGRALLEGLKARCTTRKLFTSTNESNAPMHALLKSQGFQPSGVIENLGPGDPEVVYFLDLGERSV